MKDLDGFNEFVVARSAALVRLGYLLTGDYQLGEDLVQNSLLKLAQRWRRIDNPAAYARRVMIHENTSWFRRRRREHALASVPERVSDEDTAEAVTRRAVFAAALRKLTTRQRTVIALRFYEDLSEAATAQVMGCAVGTVKSQTHYALARLRELAPELATATRTMLTSEVL